MSDVLIRAQTLNAVRELCGTLGLLHILEAARAAVGKPLPPHRLSQLATSFAWHSKRREPAERLEEGAAEVARLWERAGEGAPKEQALYLLLGRKLGLERELRQLQQKQGAQLKDLESTAAAEPDPRKRRQIEREQRPQLRKLREADELYGRVLKALSAYQIDKDSGQPWLEQITPRLNLPANQLEHWRSELRLHLAQAAVQTVQTLQATDELQQQIQHKAKTEGVFPWR